MVLSCPAQAGHPGNTTAMMGRARASPHGPAITGSPACAGDDGRGLLLSTSFDHDIGALRTRLAVVVRPGKLDRAALCGDGEKRDERVGGDRRMQVGAKNLLAVIAAYEGADDVARDRGAGHGVAVAGLHRMRDQRLDLDHVAALCLCRHIDQGLHHGDASSSRQAASVTTRFTLSDQNEPSLISAIAITFWESANRTRVDTLAFPARGPRWNPATYGCGFFSLNTWMLLT